MSDYHILYKGKDSNWDVVKGMPPYVKINNQWLCQGEVCLLSKKRMKIHRLTLATQEIMNEIFKETDHE